MRWMARASSGVGRADEPRRSSTRMALPAPFMRSIARPASGWREVKPRLPSRSRRLPRRVARRPVDRPRAEPRDRLAQPSSSIRAAASRAAASAALEGTGAARRLVSRAGRGPCRKAILSTHRQPRCAFTRSTITEALCCASSAKALSTLSTRVAGTDGASGSRLPARGGHLSSIGRAWRASVSPTMAGQSAIRLASLKPRAASASAISLGVNSAKRLAPPRPGFIIALALDARTGGARSIA